MVDRWRSGRRWILTAVGLALLLAYLFPVYWMVVTSIRPISQVFAFPPELLPRSFDLQVWRTRIFGQSNIPRYFLNSAIVGTGTAALTLALAAPAAYSLAMLRVRGKGAVALFSLTSLMFPAVMLATPLFVLFSRMGLTNSYTGLILANTALALPFALLLLRPFFLSLPKELAEAAYIDGCNAWTAFRRILLPLARPGLATVGVFTFLFGWNDLVFALSLTSSDAMRPVTAGLWNFMSANITQWNGVMAFSTLAMLPPLVIFLFAQRYVVSGLTSGSLK